MTNSVRISGMGENEPGELGVTVRPGRRETSRRLGQLEVAVFALRTAIHRTSKVYKASRDISSVRGYLPSRFTQVLLKAFGYLFYEQYY